MSELIKRILTGSLLMIATLLLILIPNKVPTPTTGVTADVYINFALVIAMVVIIAGYEFAKLNKMSLLLLSLTMALVFIVSDIRLLFTGTSGTKLTPVILFFSAVFWLKNLFLVVNYPNKKPNDSTFNKIISLYLLVAPLIVLPILQNQNISILLLLLFIVWGADSFAYFSGKAFGRHKLAPNLSGGKTIEGVIGGLVGVLLITGVWMYFYNESNWGFLLLALVTGIFSVVGDLYESIYKREAGVKDSGNILPGHGGILDRIDGLLAATPIFMIGLMFLL